MKPLIFSPTYNKVGGAVIVAHDLHQHLRSTYGIDSKMLVGRNSPNNGEAQNIPHDFMYEKMLNKITIPLGLHYIHYLSTYSEISKHRFYQEADILNFHNLHSGYFNYRALPNLTKYKPGVYTLHDMWAFTGHCSFSYDCSKWKSGCGNCPYPNIYPPIKYDNTSLEWKLKKQAYDNSNLTVIAPSKWLVHCAKNSMLSSHTVHHIPYGIDTSIYTPIEKDVAKDILQLPKEKSILLFGAMGLGDRRKGGDLLLRALELLPQSIRSEVFVLTMGNIDQNFSSDIDLPAKHLGFVADASIKSLVYSAADMLLFPTRADNLPCMILESLSSGTPVVSFNVGGVPDMVREEETGMLAEVENAAEFAKKIEEMYEDTSDNALRYQKTCRSIAVTEYSMKVQSESYLALFRDILG